MVEKLCQNSTIAEEREAKCYPTFIEELEALINKYSKENDSDTPDFILAEYLNSCLVAFSKASNRREVWYGREKAEQNPLPGSIEN